MSMNEKGTKFWKRAFKSFNKAKEQLGILIYMCFWSVSDLINVLLFIEIRDSSKCWMHKVPRLGPGRTPHFKTVPLVLTIPSLLSEKSEPPFFGQILKTQPPPLSSGSGRVGTIFMLIYFFLFVSMFVRFTICFWLIKSSSFI